MQGDGKGKWVAGISDCITVLRKFSQLEVRKLSLLLKQFHVLQEGFFSVLWQCIFVTWEEPMGSMVLVGIPERQQLMPLVNYVPFSRRSEWHIFVAPHPLWYHAAALKICLAWEGPFWRSLCTPWKDLFCRQHITPMTDSYQWFSI